MLAVLSATLPHCEIDVCIDLYQYLLFWASLTWLDIFLALSSHSCYPNLVLCMFLLLLHFFRAFLICLLK